MDPSFLSPPGLFTAFARGLARTRERLRGVGERLRGKGPVDSALLDTLEEALLAADLGPSLSQALLSPLRTRLARREFVNGDELRQTLITRITQLLAQATCPPDFLSGDGIQVCLLVGVNGSGKTTTAAKIAARCRQEERRVLLVAADTFRAAASDQLQSWGERVGVEVIRKRPGTDPAAVVFDALSAARPRGSDILIVDTAGRLHTKVTLMEELRKIVRIIGREVAGAPHESLLVLDATVGTNALTQAREFVAALPLTGLVITKLDGTAKGGAVLAIVEELKIPVRFVATGEGLNDLSPFSPKHFALALFSDTSDADISP